MFVRNHTSLDPVLAGGQLVDGVSVACVSVELVYGLGEDGGLMPVSVTDRAAWDPPDIRRSALWRGTSVTAFGHVIGPLKPPYKRTVRLSVGDYAHEVVVFGPRTWVSAADQLIPSDPGYFERLPLSWSLAFGGSYDLPAGHAPGTDLPHPGGRLAHPLNPGGVGWYADKASAAGKPLPSIERPQELIGEWSATPTPAGMAPCRELPQLRINDLAAMMGAKRPEADEKSQLRAALDTYLQMLHHAPTPLIVDEVKADTAVTLDGLGTPAVSVTVPAAPLVVTVSRKKQDSRRLHGRLRSLHIDADRNRARLVWGYLHRFATEKAPWWIVCEEAA